MSAIRSDIRDGLFAVIHRVTYQVDVERLDTLGVWRGANDLSGRWRPDLSDRPVIDELPCSTASRIFGVRTFAKWGDVGVRIVHVRHDRNKATAFYIASDLKYFGPPDWPRPMVTLTAPRPGMSSLKSHGSDPEGEYAGEVGLDELTDVRSTEVEIERDENGNLLPGSVRLFL